MPRKIRVWAPEGQPPAAYFNELGQLVRDRHVARDSQGKPMSEGEEVFETAEIVRHIRRGELVIEAPKPAPSKPPDPVQPSPPPKPKALEFEAIEAETASDRSEE